MADYSHREILENREERRTSIPAMPAYQDYPPCQPFIHDDYRRDANRPVIAYPESNRQGENEDIICRNIEVIIAYMSILQSTTFQKS